MIGRLRCHTSSQEWAETPEMAVINTAAIIVIILVNLVFEGVDVVQSIMKTTLCIVNRWIYTSYCYSYWELLCFLFTCSQGTQHNGEESIRSCICSHKMEILINVPKNWLMQSQQEWIWQPPPFSRKECGKTTEHIPVAVRERWMSSCKESTTCTQH